MLPRFFVPGLEPSEELVALPAGEARHLGKVLRLGPGAEVRVFDGNGREWRAEVVDVSRDAARIRVRDTVVPAPEPHVALALVMAVLKGDKMDDVVRDAVMLGVKSVHPVVTARTEIGAGALARSARVERWQRIAIASAKQCGRAVVPIVHAPQPIDTYLASDCAPGERRLMLVEPEASTVGRPLRDIEPPAAAALVTGPEGGWMGDELARAVESGATPVRLGRRTLRADAVPLVALAMCQALWDEG